MIKGKKTEEEYKCKHIYTKLSFYGSFCVRTKELILLLVIKSNDTKSSQIFDNK